MARRIRVRAGEVVEFSVEHKNRIGKVPRDIASARYDEWLLVAGSGDKTHLLEYLPGEIAVESLSEDELREAWQARYRRRRLLLLDGLRVHLEVDPDTVRVSTGRPPGPASPRLGADVFDGNGRKLWSGILERSPRGGIEDYSPTELEQLWRAKYKPAEKPDA